MSRYFAYRHSDVCSGAVLDVNSRGMFVVIMIVINMCLNIARFGRIGI